MKGSGIRDQGSGFRVRVEVEGKVRARVRHEAYSMSYRDMYAHHTD